MRWTGDQREMQHGSLWESDAWKTQHARDGSDGRPWKLACGSPAHDAVEIGGVHAPEERAHEQRRLGLQEGDGREIGERSERQAKEKMRAERNAREACGGCSRLPKEDVGDGADGLGA